MQIFLSDINEANFSRTDGAKDKQPRKIRRAGRDWIPNKVYPSDRAGKKKMVLASKRINGETKYKILHFGAKGYGHNYSEKARKSYLARSAGIRNKAGELTSKDPWSPNRFARKYLWGGKGKNRLSPPKK